MDVNPFPTERVDAKPREMRTSWLIENIWLESACGIIGGQPKCCKSWLGLEMALAVATGTPCLGRFAIPNPGPALVFMAEDRVEEVHGRVQHLARSRGISLAQVDMHLVTAPVVRLDSDEDCARLHATLESLNPKILLLDPLVRLHRLDENSAREISGLLGYLRELERRHQVAIVLTHHASKRAHARPGQGLRGSSDLHAFGDSNIYLSRKGDELELAVEHRSAAAMEPITLRLENEPSVHLAIVGDKGEYRPPQQHLNHKVVEMLKDKSEAWTRSRLREQLRVNNQRLGIALQELIQENKIHSTEGKYMISS